MNIADITITSLETITAFDITSGDYKFTLDELQNTNIAQGQETTPITGKQGRRLNTIKRNKTVNVTGANGLVSAGLMEIQTGSSFVTGNTEVLWRDYLTVTSNAATTTYKAVGTTGNEIDKVYVKDGNGAITRELEQDASTAVGKFTYTPGTKALAFNTGDLADGTEILVIYKRKISASVLSNDSGKYSEKVKLYVDAIGEDPCNNIYHVQYYFPAADFSGEFSLALGGEQTVHNFSFDALSSGCVGGNFFTYTVFGASAEDAP